VWISSTCFGRWFRPSSGALDCVYSFFGALYHMLSLFKLLIHCYCCIQLVVYTIVSEKQVHTNIKHARFQASSAVTCDLRSSEMLTRRRSVANYRRFGCLSVSTSRVNPNEWRLGTDFVPKRRQPTTDLRCVASQSGEDLSQKYFFRYVIIVAWGGMAWVRSGVLARNKYRCAPHNDVSVNDGPHIRQRSHNIILPIVLQLPTVFSTVTCCTGL